MCALCFWCFWCSVKQKIVNIIEYCSKKKKGKHLNIQIDIVIVTIKNTETIQPKPNDEKIYNRTNFNIIEKTEIKV